MKRWMGWSVLVIGLLGAAGLLVVDGVVLRDLPARPAAGEARFAPASEATIEYRVSGDSAGPVVVLFPSFGRSAADFNELVAALSEAGYRTLALQPRGVEGSSLPSGEFTYHTYASDIGAVLDAEGIIDPVHLIGHAYGNRIARTFATDSPERTRSVTLLAAGGAEATPAEGSQDIATAMMGLASEEERRAAIARAFFAEGNPVTADWMHGWYPRAGLAQAAAIPRSPFEEWGAGGGAPILVLQPAEDAVAANGGRLLAEAHPSRVSLIEVVAAGHAILPERPEFVARQVLAFLAGR